jgi:hypothetical protein
MCHESRTGAEGNHPQRDRSKEVSGVSRFPLRMNWGVLEDKSNESVGVAAQQE